MFLGVWRKKTHSLYIYLSDCPSNSLYFKDRVKVSIWNKCQILFVQIILKIKNKLNFYIKAIKNMAL